MLTLKSLTFSGIGRFVEEQSIDFTSLGSLVQVDGQNNNTKGSSGAGKSTVFKALEFLFGLNDISNTVLQSRLTKEPLSVSGIFDLDGQSLKIERGKKLLIDLNGETTTGSSKITEEKLDQLIGMDRDLFRKILHKRQGEGGFFLQMGPSDVHKFLTNCLSLQKEQTKIVTLDARLFKLTDEEISLKSAVESLKSALQATRNAISSLTPISDVEIDSDTLEAIRVKYVEAIDNYKLVQEGHKREIEDLERNRPKAVSLPFDRSKTEQLENEICTIVSQITVLEDNEKQRCIWVKTKISDLQIEISKLNNAELTRQSEVKSNIASLLAEVAKLESLEQKRQSEVQNKLSTNKVEQIRASNIAKDGAKAKEDAIKLGEELKKVRASICPTCEQSWINDAAKAKETAILQKLQEHKKAIIAGMEAEKRGLTLEEERNRLLQEKAPRPIPTNEGIDSQLAQLRIDSQPKIVPEIQLLNEKIDQLRIDSQPQSIPEAIELKLKTDFKNQELTELRKLEREHQVRENAKSQAALDIFAQKQTALRQSHEETLRSLQNKQDLAKSEYMDANNKIENYKETKKRFEESNTKLTLQLNTSQYDLELKCRDLHKVQEEIELAQEAKKAIKSYLSCSFEDALDSIGDAATKMVRNIPNLSNATIQFEGLKETKEGKIKEEVNCIINIDGEIGVPIKSLSGGERSSLDLAIDLAVVQFIEERTGKGSNLFIMDEPFQFLDSINIEQILEMIIDSGISKTIVFVDHNPVVKEMVGNRITVVRDGEYSRIAHEKIN